MAVLTSSNTIFMSSAGTLDTPNTPKTQFGGLYSAESVLMDAWIFSGREVFNHKSRGSILGGILVNIFINNLGEETDGMLNKFLDSTNLERRSKSSSRKISTGRNDGPNLIDSI